MNVKLSKRKSSYDRVIVIINAHIELAAKIDVDNSHIGYEDMSVQVVRKIFLIKAKDSIEVTDNIAKYADVTIILRIFTNYIINGINTKRNESVFFL